MYLDYWGFEKFPFDNVPDPDFFYASEPHKEGLTRLIYAAEMRKGCAMLAGDIGCGKTTMSKVFLKRISEQRYDVAIISNPSMGPKQLLQEVLYKFKITDIPENKFEILRELHNKLTENMRKNKETILIIDEAQLLSKETMEEIRLLLNFQLSNRFLLTAFLLGQPELIENIKRVKALEQRIAIRYFLKPFNFKETIKYILFRQKKAGGRKNVYTRQAIEMVYKHSNGMPRSINNFCDMALLVGFGQKTKMITSAVIRDIIEDGEIF
ncbi:MAG: AAA family ATPase [Bacteroidota bacterium]|nr:AAA family ATPase [Bacteroidota bacterium]